MNSLAQQVLLDNPEPIRSHPSPKGYWNEAVEAVRTLVTQGFSVAEASRLVVVKMGVTHDRAASQLRSAYYNRHFREHRSQR